MPRHPSCPSLHRDQLGFTLIELLVVVLIIGILGAIALPVFLGQQKKGQDAAAKSNARNAVTQVESCLADATTGSAASCGTAAGNPGLKALGGRVVVTNAAVSSGGPTYEIVASSSSGHIFTVAKKSSGALEYTADPADARWAENGTS